MIAKYRDFFYRNVNVSGEKAEISNPDLTNTAIVPRESVDLYYSESELQQKIESAVAEDRKSNSENLKKVMINVDKEITDLRMQVEELKAKLPQPVEISQELVDAIEWIKKAQEFGSGIELFVNHLCEWEFIFLSCAHYETKEIDVPFKIREALGKTSLKTRLAIIKNGYTVKPEPTLQEEIEKSLSLSEWLSKDISKKVMTILKQRRLIKDEEA